MKKILLLLNIMMCIGYYAFAGYYIIGIPSNGVNYDNLMNYTLSFDGSGKPIAAATMFSNYAFGNGRNTIIILPSDILQPAHIFPLRLANEPKIQNVEVRDFKKVTDDLYLICGSRQIDNDINAFVAVVYNNFERMLFYEYPVADCFYSIWPGDPTLATQLDYAVCGVKGDRAVVGSLDRTTLSLNNFYQTEIPWEYHKIILKKNPDGHSGIFVVSGRNPSQDTIGFSTVDASFTQINSNAWAQYTEPASHCVVSDYRGNYRILIASSYGDVVTLSLHTISGLTAAPRAYHFIMPNSIYHIQDIGTFLQDNDSLRISVAGFTSSAPPVQFSAWHGHIYRLSSTSSMMNNYYFETNVELYKHYKIGYSDGEEYTGGYFEGETNGVYSTCALFSSPLKLNVVCDNIYPSDPPYIETFYSSSFYLQSLHPESQFYFCESEENILESYGYCGELKGSKSPQFSMQTIEKESEIATFYDRITVKYTPSGTNYQIFSVTGQLIQTGTTNPDISISQLSKGMYILRLETGKAFKFVK